LGVDARTSKDVKDREALRQQFFPKVKKKITVGGAEAGDKMIFEGPNGAFCGVSAVAVRRGKLEFNAILVH
jgi:hypothetical protein